MALFKMPGFPKHGKSQEEYAQQMQQLDNMIADAKKLGKDGTAQVLVNKKSKLEDEMEMAASKEKYYSKKGGPSYPGGDD
jgi:hypothetical protein